VKQHGSNRNPIVARARRILVARAGADAGVPTADRARRALAVLAGAVAFGVTVVAERVLEVSWVRGLLLVAFGALALIGYKVIRANVRNGAVVAAIAGVALLAVAGGTVGLVTGLLVFAGAMWGLLKSF